MASGLPIITTPEGAEGIPARNNNQIVVEDDLTSLTEKVIIFLRNPAFAEKIGQEGKKFVKDNFDWSKSALKLDQLYQKIGHGKN